MYCLILDDDQIEKWKEEKKKLLGDFLTKEGEIEFLRLKISQVQTRYENEKKEQSRLMQEQDRRSKAEIEKLVKDKSIMESRIEYHVCKISNTFMCYTVDNSSNILIE